MTNEETKSNWIEGPVFDLVFLAFGWIVVASAFTVLFYFHEPARVGPQRILWNLDEPWVAGLITVVLVVNFIHRNLTHVLVYGDRRTFGERRISYIVLPIGMLILPFVAARYQTTYYFFTFSPFLLGLMGLSMVWNFYHTLMQKIGLLRIYARKAGGRSSALDRSIVFSWFFFLLFALLSSEAIRVQVSAIGGPASYALRYLSPYTHAVVILKWLALAAAVVVSVLYIKGEWEERRGPLAPKNIFLLSILLLYGLFARDFVTAFASFSFSHTVEYIAFVGLFAKKKYGDVHDTSTFLGKISKYGGWSFAFFCLAAGGIYLIWNKASAGTFGLFYISTSFLHYIYDGWIWKIRRPQVGTPLGLAYERAT